MMLRFGRTGISLMTAVLALAVATTSEAGRGAHRGASSHHRNHRLRAAKFNPVRFIRMPGVRGGTGTGDVAVAVPGSQRLRLSVDRPLGSRGVGSLGYQRLGASPLDVHEVNAAAGTQFGAPSAVVGGGVSYRF